MSEEEAYFNRVGEAINGGQKSQMFGKPCYKIGKKAFVCFFEHSMVFKLSGEVHKMAMSLEGVHLFDPSGKSRPMKEWVQVPFESKDKWVEFAKEAADYVAGN